MHVGLLIASWKHSRINNDFDYTTYTNMVFTYVYTNEK